MGEPDGDYRMDWQRVTDQISKRVDSLEAMIAGLVGRPPPEPSDRRWFGVAPLTWAAIVTAVATLGGVAVAILQQSP